MNYLLLPLFFVVDDVDYFFHLLRYEFRSFLFLLSSASEVVLDGGDCFSMEMTGSIQH